MRDDALSKHQSSVFIDHPEQFRQVREIGIDRCEMKGLCMSHPCLTDGVRIPFAVP